ncbi:transposable element Tcb1 transposase [Trichonephila clavipes]|nr:transposable element Tcb1 transposase [Trichonephila clavipes]
MDRAATSQALSQELGSFSRSQMSARTVRRHLQQHGLSARRPWLEFYLQHQDGRIRVRWHSGERPLAACIPRRHTVPSPGMMVWGYWIHISVISCSHSRPTMKQDNARPHVASIVQTFLNTECVRLLPWPARSTIENFWSMVAGLLARHTAVTTVEKL